MREVSGQKCFSAARFPLEAVAKFVKLFERDPKPTGDVVTALVEETGIERKRIMRWFSDRRKSLEMERKTAPEKHPPHIIAKLEAAYKANPSMRGSELTKLANKLKIERHFMKRNYLKRNLFSLSVVHRPKETKTDGTESARAQAPREDATGIVASSRNRLFSSTQDTKRWSSKREFSTRHSAVANKRLANYGKFVGERLLDVISLREKGYKRETRLLATLIFIKSTVWKKKLVYNDDQKTYLLIERDPVVNTFISMPKDKSNLNCAAFVAGIVMAMLLDECNDRVNSSPN